MIITSCFKKYEIKFENDFEFILRLLAMENTFFVIDKKVYDLYETTCFQTMERKRIYLLDALEENKTIETALSICEKMTEIPAKKNAVLISFGGGIIQDITGFVANILYRGIKWIFIPTTLLAASDSCIGGKTSLNYKSFKNLLGTFYPPDEIIYCPRFFETLSSKDYLSGLGEVVKFNLMDMESGLINIEKDIDSLLRRDIKTLQHYVITSLEFKKKYIEVDEFDKAERIMLNFAHTFGHAFETMSHYEIPHGTAVAMGMVIANRIALSRNMITEEKVLRMETVLNKIIPQRDYSDYLDLDTFIFAVHKDKKQTSDSITGILMDEMMKLHIVKDISKTEIKDALDKFMV